MKVALPVIDPARCTGCGWCVAVRPPSCAVAAGAGGQPLGPKRSVLDDAPGCTGCALCAVRCPLMRLRCGVVPQPSQRSRDEWGLWGPRAPDTKEFTMSEKKASVHWEGASKAGQARSAPRRARWTAYPTALPAGFGDDPQGHQPKRFWRGPCGLFHDGVFIRGREGGVATESADTTASVRLSKDGDGFVIDRIALTLKAKVPGLTTRRFKTGG